MLRNQLETGGGGGGGGGKGGRGGEAKRVSLYINTNTTIGIKGEREEGGREEGEERSEAGEREGDDVER